MSTISKQYALNMAGRLWSGEAHGDDYDRLRAYIAASVEPERYDQLLRDKDAIYVRWQTAATIRRIVLV